MPASTFDLLQHIQTVGILHANCPKDSTKATRNWDGKTPFVYHPIWCAATIVTEQKLSEDMRQIGALALLYHDVLEDTNGNLPPNLSKEVINAIRSLTFESKSSRWEDIRVLPPEFRLLKLYDKTSNLLDPITQDSADLLERQKIVRLLIEDVLRHFGELNITKIARSLIPKEPF